MAYADLTDVNVHLDNKARVTDALLPDLNIEVQRTIRARLSGIFTNVILDGWVDPASTPPIIRSIAGRLIAALFYARLIAEDDAAGSKFAQDMYNSAISDLNEIRAGNLTVEDPSGVEIDSEVISETSFWPNNTTQPPSFAVADVWS